MSKIITVEIKHIAINPYRRLHTYPYIQSKLDALQRSIQEVGLWPSVIARPIGEHRLWQYELAFGHHRIEAARRLGLKDIPLIVDRLSDTQMLQYMGRENLEDYNASFLIQLESWEAAIKSGLVRSGGTDHAPQPIDIARLLGWSVLRSDRDTGDKLNATASACSAAYALIQGGYNTRDDFADLTVEAARLIAERAYARMKQIDEIGKTSGRSTRETEKAKRQYGRGAADTAQQVREGTITRSNVRSRVDFNATARTRADDRPSPLFAVFANAVADNLRRTLQTDSDAEKLTQVAKALSQVSMLEDWESLRRLKVELVNLSERAIGWDKRLTPTKEKVVQLRALEKGRG